MLVDQLPSSHLDMPNIDNSVPELEGGLFSFRDSAGIGLKTDLFINQHETLSYYIQLASKLII